GLEAEAPDAEATAPHALGEGLIDHVEKHLLLPFVDALDCLEDSGIDAVLGERASKRHDILREAAAAVAAAGKEEGAADALIGADALAHQAHVRADLV